MKARFLILWFLMTAAAMAQTVPIQAIKSVTSAPSGQCPQGLPNQQVISTGVQYSCQNVANGIGTWGQVSNPSIVPVPSTPTSCATLPLQVVNNTANVYGTNGSGGCTPIGSSASIPTIPGGNTVAGWYDTSSADWGGLLPPGNPANLGINFWVKGSGTKDLYTVFQAGNGASARDYLAFLDYDGSYKWLIGKNGALGPNAFILYDAIAGVHRMYMQSAADGSGGPTYINGFGGAVTIDGNDPGDSGGLSSNGGFQVWGGGSGGSGATERFSVADSGETNIAAFGPSGGFTPSPLAALAVHTPTSYYAIAAKTDTPAASGPGIIDIQDGTGDAGIFGSYVIGGVNTFLMQAQSGRTISLWANASATAQWVLNRDGSRQLVPRAFSTLAACASGNEGSEAYINDSTTNTHAATISGGGTDHVKGICYYNGTTYNWTVEFP